MTCVAWPFFSLIWITMPGRALGGRSIGTSSCSAPWLAPLAPPVGEGGRSEACACIIMLKRCGEWAEYPEGQDEDKVEVEVEVEVEEGPLRLQRGPSRRRSHCRDALVRLGRACVLVY